MGLRDWIPGVGSGHAADDVETLYLIDATPWKTELRDYRLLIGPSRATDSEAWTIYRCTEDETTIPEGAELFVFQEGRVVSEADRPFQLHLAQIVLKRSNKDIDGYYVEFPAELTGETYDEQRLIDDNELTRYVRSLPADF